MNRTIQAYNCKSKILNVSDRISENNFSTLLNSHKDTFTIWRYFYEGLPDGRSFESLSLVGVIIMQKWTYLTCITLLTVIIFVGCSTTEKAISNNQQTIDSEVDDRSDTSIDTTDSEQKENKVVLEENKEEPVIPEFVFLQTVDLDFFPVEMSPLKEESPQDNWEMVKEMPFGSVHGEEVTLFIYQEKQEDRCWTSSYRAQLSFQGKTYTISSCVSDYIMQYIPDEVEVIFKPIYQLEHTFEDQNSQLFLLGGIELFANGPGLVVLLVYDSMNEEWLEFESWGAPHVIDLDSDGQKEFLIEFPGLHLQTPNVSIYRWYNDRLERGTSLASALVHLDYSHSHVYIEWGEPTLFSVNVDIIVESEMIHLGTAFYRYENGQLIMVSDPEK